MSSFDIVHLPKGESIDFRLIESGNVIQLSWIDARDAYVDNDIGSTLIDHLQHERILRATARELRLYGVYGKFNVATGETTWTYRDRVFCRAFTAANDKDERVRIIKEALGLV